MEKIQEYKGHTYRVERNAGKLYRIYVDEQLSNHGRSTETRQELVEKAKLLIDKLQAPNREHGVPYGGIGG